MNRTSPYAAALELLKALDAATLPEIEYAIAKLKERRLGEHARRSKHRKLLATAIRKISNI